MSKLSRSKAEEQFAATQKKAKQVQKEKERAWQERTEHMAKLRALRLAKEAADKEAAEAPAGKDDTPPDLPKVHRR